jgi:GH18 family chitinase
LLGVLLLPACAGAPTAPTEPRPLAEGTLVIGYLGSWGVPAKLRIDDIRGEALTHICYAFGTVGQDGRAALGDPCRDTGQCGGAVSPTGAGGNFEQLRLLKQRYPHLKVLISLGGWGGSRWFSNAAASNRARRTLVSSTLDVFLRPYPDLFDGVDVDWEYPVGGGMPANTARPQDRHNYTLLLQEYRRQLDALGQERGRAYQLSIAAAAGPSQLPHLEPAELARVLDFINVMTYDYHSGDTIAHFNSPLRAITGDPVPLWNVEASIRGFLDAGVPPRRLVVGAPFYARGLGGVAPANNGLLQAGSDAAAGEWRAVDYRVLVERQPERHGFTRYWHAEAQVPWLYHRQTRTFVSYDDPQSISAKARYVREQGLGGIMFWELGGDNGELLQAIQDGLGRGEDAAAAGIEQEQQGFRTPARLVASFDGLGAGFTGPDSAATFRNPSDNSLAVGPDHIVEIVNSRFAVYTKKGERFDTTGRVLRGPVPTNWIWAGFGGRCEPRPNGDAVVRYDQLAGRWLFVMPIFRRDTADAREPYSMCYAVTQGADPLGPYHRYEFKRALFPDYPRPALWTDGYYTPTSTGDDIIQKHACVADRARMLQGLPATEQCVILDGVGFLNSADIDGPVLPPAGAPNILLAAGGAQLRRDYDDDGIYVWEFRVDWDDPAKTRVTGPRKLAVEPYTYLCGGQLTSCVPQPGTARRLDAQGDKLMQRLVYRNLGTHEAIVATHSVNSAAGGGGVRWYEFRLDSLRQPQLFQQGTYAPDRFYRWMGSIGMDRHGNIAVGYSFGGTPHYPGQRLAARLAGDPPGRLTVREAVLVHGQASQQSTLRWEDYTTLALDPTDDCTFWYVGDYLKAGQTGYTTRIGAFRLPGCPD